MKFFVINIYLFLFSNVSFIFGIFFKLPIILKLILLSIFGVVTLMSIKNLLNLDKKGDQ